MTNTSFPERLAYLVWLQHLRTGECPSNTDIAKGVGLTQGAISQWWGRPAAPTDIDRLEALVSYFGITGHMEWLRKGTGEPPRVALWREWEGARHDHLAAPTLPAEALRVETGTPKKDRRAAGKRRR